MSQAATYSWEKQKKPALQKDIHVGGEYSTLLVTWLNEFIQLKLYKILLIILPQYFLFNLPTKTFGSQ